jgi:hypothetical protein
MKIINQTLGVIMLKRILASVTAVMMLAGIGMGTAASASASVVTGPAYNLQLAGYQTLSAGDFNQVRATVTDEPNSISSPGVVLADNSLNGGAYVLALLPSGHADVDNVEYNANVTVSAGIISAPHADWVATGVTVQQGTPEYLEVYNSTRSHQIVFVTGSETAQFVAARVTNVPGQDFSAPTVGTFFQSVPSTFTGIHGTPAEQSAFTRVGVTVPVNNHGLRTGTRYSYSAFTQNELVADSTATAPGPNEPAASPSAFGVGSSFSVNLNDSISGHCHHCGSPA